MKNCKFRIKRPTRLFLIVMLILFFEWPIPIFSENIFRAFLFWIGMPLMISLNIISTKVAVEINESGLKIILGKLTLRKSKFLWEEIKDISDDFFFIFHMYHIESFGASDRSPKIITISNIVIQNYELLLANIITHVKPTTHVDKTILNHLNMNESDIGKFYGTERWVDSVQSSSYWKMKRITSK